MMAHDVFISYSSKDRTTVEAIVNKFEHEKIRCWYADRDIPGGEDWAASIIRALKSAKVFLLVFTDYSNESSQVLREVNMAVSNGIPIVPFRLTPNMPSGGMEYYLSTVHWLDAMNDKLEVAIDNLYELCRAILEKREYTIKPVPSPASNDKKKSSKKKVIILSSVIAALIALAAVFLIFKPDKKEVSGGNEINFDELLDKPDGSVPGTIRGEEFEYDVIGLRDYVKDGGKFENGKPVYPDEDYDYELYNIYKDENDENMATYEIELHPRTGTPEYDFVRSHNYYGIYLNVNTETWQAEYGGYPIDARTKDEAMTFIEKFADYYGYSSCIKEDPVTYEVIEEYPFEDFCEIIQTESIEKEMNYVIANDVGDRLKIYKGEDNAVYFILCFDHNNGW